MPAPRSFLSSLIALLSALAPAGDAPAAPPPAAGPGISLRRAISFPLVLPSALPPYRFVVPSDEGPIEVTLRRHSIRSPGFRWLVRRGGALVPLVPPAPRTLRGTAHLPSGAVVPAAGARVHGGVSLVIQAPQGRLYVQPVSGGPIHVSYRERDTFPGPWRCGVVDELAPTPGTKAASSGVVITDLAVEADTFYAQAFGGDPATVLDDIESVLNLVSFLFENEVGVTFEISALVVQTGPSDHYTSTAADSLLKEMRDFWNKNLGGIKRDLAHLATGRDLDGNIVGLAYLGVVCTNPPFSYGLTQLKFSPNLSLRVALMAHEIGHNFGADHCDADPDCSIMCSVLALCSGNISDFGQSATSQILAQVQKAKCLQSRPGPLPAPFADGFASKKLSSQRWSKFGGAKVSSAAVGEPSGKRALLLDVASSGVPDEATTRPIDVTSLSQPAVSLLYQARGLENGETLRLLGRRTDGSFGPIGTITADGSEEDIFSPASFPLPAGMIHGAFQLRLRTGGDDGDDRWFVDDVRVEQAQPAPSGPLLCGEGLDPVLVTDMTGGSPPASGQVAVSNCGKAGSSLPWTASAAVGGFFSISPASGTVTPQESADPISVTFGAAGAGLHLGVLRVTNGATQGDVADVPVVLAVHPSKLFVPGDTLQGTISSPGETDEASFVAPEGAKLTLTVTVPNGDLKPVVQLVDSSGTTLSTLKFPSSKKGSKKKVKLKQSDVLRLIVSGKGGTTGDYEIQTALKVPKSGLLRVQKVKPSSKGGTATMEVAVLAAGRALVTVAPSKEGQGPYDLGWTDPAGNDRAVAPYVTKLPGGGAIARVPVAWPGIHELRVGGFAKKESVIVTVSPPVFTPGQSTITLP